MAAKDTALEEEQGSEEMGQGRVAREEGTARKEHRKPGGSTVIGLRDERTSITSGNIACEAKVLSGTWQRRACQMESHRGDRDLGKSRAR